MPRAMKPTLLCVLFFSPIVWASAPDLQSGIDCKLDQISDIQHYYVSEKYDGVRAFWDGKQLLSRQGHRFKAPSWFLSQLPNFPLDGELWIERQEFDQVSAIVRRQKPLHWERIHYKVFDAPAMKGSFKHRLRALQQWQTLQAHAFISVIDQQQFDSKPALLLYFDQITEAGAEGLMLHHEEARYQPGRNPLLCKLKPYQDAEAKVVAHTQGKGAFKNMLGALIVEDAQGRRFKIGSGFSLVERQNPPKVGEFITFRYNGFTKNNKPRFARFLRIYERF